MAGKEQFKEYLGQVLPQQNFFYRAARAMTGSREGASCAQYGDALIGLLA